MKRNTEVILLSNNDNNIGIALNFMQNNKKQ